jgi:hypothetical protein
MTARAVRLLPLLVLSLLAGGCGTLYTRPYPGGVIEPRDPRYTLGIVELDDQGWFVDRRQVKKVLDEAQKAVDQNGATLVVYVHGWHHNAGSPNVEGFRQTLICVQQQVDSGVYKMFRSAALPGAANRVVGIYVGWRGRALPGPLLPLSFWTFWNRRAAALRVGHGDVPELLNRIHTIYARGNEQPTPTPGDKQAVLRNAGLVIVGHSFGAQVVFAALGDVLKQRISAEIDVDQMGTTADVLQKIDGFGDLVVLVNPAVEASVYESISGMVRDKRFPEEQPPVMLTLSSEADWPNRWPFSYGRKLGVGHEPIGRRGQFGMKTHAIGNVESQVTHCLRQATDLPCDQHPSRPPVAIRSEPSEQDLTRLLADPRSLIEELCTSPPFPLSSEVRLMDGRFRLEPVRDGSDPNLPFLLARTKRSILSGHSDVFSDNIRDFLVHYVSLVESKRLVSALRSRCVGPQNSDAPAR